MNTLLTLLSPNALSPGPSEIIANAPKCPKLMQSYAMDVSPPLLVLP